MIGADNVGVMNDPRYPYSIPESYRNTWDSTLIAAITQPAAHLDQYAKRFNVEGEYLKLQTLGSADAIQRRKQRHETIVWEELTYGERLIAPVAFGKALALSKDDFTYKGKLPLTLNTLHDALEAVARPVADRVFLGVVYDEDKQECVIAPDGNEISPYQNDGSDGVNLVTHDGHYGGILGTMHTGKNGATKVKFPTHPFINGAEATDYAQYKTDLSKLNLKKTSVIPVTYAKDSDPVESGLTLEKIRAARLAMVLRHAITANETVCMAITPWQMEDLLTLQKMENKDYGFGSINTTSLNSFLNVKFLVTVDVPIVNIGGKWVRACPMWVQRDVGFGIWKNIEFGVRELPDKWDTVLATAQFSYAAGRMREESVMTIHCAETGLDNLSA